MLLGRARYMWNKRVKIIATFQNITEGVEVSERCVATCPCVEP